MFEEKSNTALRIISALGRALDFLLKRKEIIDQTGLTESQVHNSLYRLKQIGIVINNGNDRNIPRGYWRLRKLFRKIRHCLRIIETRQKRKDNEWNCDAEATSEGYVPYTGLPIPPKIPQDKLTASYADVLTPKLRYEFLTILGRNDIMLTDSQTEIARTCNPSLFLVPRFCIEGTEWLDELSDNMGGGVHDVEVIFKNANGDLYPPGVGNWSGRFFLSEDDFRQ